MNQQHLTTMTAAEATLARHAALAKRDAAFGKALYDRGLERSRAWGNYTLKQRARNPAIGQKYEQSCERIEAKYRTTRAFAQEEYLATLASIDARISGDSDAGLYDSGDTTPTPAPAPRVVDSAARAKRIAELKTHEKEILANPNSTMEDLDRLIDAQIKEELRGFKEDLGQNYDCLPRHTEAELEEAYALQRKDSDPASIFSYTPPTH